MRAQKTTKTGKIIPHGVKPAPHELDTILFFTEMGKDVELIPPSHTPHVKTADFHMDGLDWEAKSPSINARKAIERMFYRSNQQSSNIIFDLRRLKGDDKMAINLLEKCFKSTRKVRNMYIITSGSSLKTYRK